MKKVVRDGKVAVLISRGFGAGWYTWNKDHEELLFHPKLIEIVSDGDAEEITSEWLEVELGLKDVYPSGKDGLTVEWVEEGMAFTVKEYDGKESLSIVGFPEYIIA